VTNPLVSLSEQLASTVQEAAQSVVAIHARARYNSSGVHWSPGVVVTASHAIRHDEDIRITTPDGSTLSAELAGRDPGTDLAVLRAKDLKIPVAARSDSGSLKIGNVILAVGRFKDSVSAGFGVLSSISGPSQTWRGGRLDQVLRLDIALQAGAAGGAVVDAAGKLIGVATPALSRVSVFAIPLATLERVTETLLAHGRIPRGYLGVGLQPIAIPEHLKAKVNHAASVGLIAVSVDADAPAGRAGMTIGDVLLDLGGRAIEETEDVQAALDSSSIGKKLKARILRGGNAMELEITVGERPRRG
jgi:S1-C subfamily serine protease